MGLLDRILARKKKHGKITETAKRRNTEELEKEEEENLSPKDQHRLTIKSLRVQQQTLNETLAQISLIKEEALAIVRENGKGDVSHVEREQREDGKEVGCSGLALGGKVSPTDGGYPS